MTYTVDESGAIPMWVSDSITFDSTDATWLVLHKTAGFTSAAECAAYFIAGSDVSAHYIVGQGENEIVQCVPESRGAGANCCVSTGHAAYLPTDVNLNIKTISIEHIDPAIDNSTPLTPAQQAASFKLIRDICARHNIPMRPGDVNGGIIGHMDIDPVNRARCPGNYPWSELWSYLSSNATGDEIMLNLSDPMGRFFQQAPGNAWSCASKNTLIGNAMLDFYRQHGGIFGLPLTNEFGLSQYAGVTFQVFERAIQVFGALQGEVPPGSGQVYLLQIMSGLGQQLVSKPLITSLQDQIKQLQLQVAQLQSEPTDITALQQQIASLQQAIELVYSTVQPLHK